MTHPADLTATEAAARIRQSKLRPAELVEACLDRIRTCDPDLGAFVHVDRDLSVASAEAMEKIGPRGPLWGLPLAVKDVLDTADMPTAYGSPIWAGFRPRADAAAVAQARSSGAIILGKTATTEFATRKPSRTVNPINKLHTPGGSSSGSAAAVAAALCPIAFGTQTAGSIIRPAAFCGVVGYKPTFGYIHRAGMKKDELGWAHSNNACYTVSSAYSALGDQLPTLPWTLFWKLALPPKIKMFLWLTFKGKLMTNVQRTVRKMTSISDCKSCPGVPENIEHIFLHCELAVKVWDHWSLVGLAPNLLYHNLHSWLSVNLQHKADSDSQPWFILFAFSLWVLWKARCDLSFNNLTSTDYKSIQLIKALASEWKNSFAINEMVYSPRKGVGWSKPPSGTIKLNTDGNCAKSGLIRVGGVLRDKDGAWLSGFSKLIGYGSVILAEAWALYIGLSLTWRLGYDNVQVETDSLELCNLLNKQGVPMKSMRLLITRCKLLLSK